MKFKTEDVVKKLPRNNNVQKKTSIYLKQHNNVVDRNKA